MLQTRWGQPIRLEELFAGRHEVTIGRNSGNTLVLSSKLAATSTCKIPDGLVLQLSRVHARMALKDGLLQIQDLATLNGTYINNARLPKEEWRVLSEGDIVTLGGTDPLALDGEVMKNPWRFLVQGVQEFLATRPRVTAATAVLSDSHHNSGATGATGTTILADGSGPGAAAREVYSFSNQVPQRPDRSTEVIDLTIDDSPPAPPKAKRHKRAEAPAATAPAPQGGGASELVKQLLEQYMCPICCEPVVGTYSVAPCGHHHCGSCLLGWLQSRANQPTCPMCRESCTAPPVRSNAIDNTVALMMERLPAGDRADWEERKREWEANRQDIEAKLKVSVRGGGGGAGANPLTAAMGALEALERLQGTIQAVVPPRRVHVPRSDPRIAAPPAAQNFRTQYATGAEMCSVCRARIQPGALIMGIGTGGGGGRRGGRGRGSQGGSFNWHHFNCFPAGLWPATVVSGIENFRNLNPTDASRLRDRMSGYAG